MPGRPFDDIRSLIQQLPPLEAKAARGAEMLISALPGRGAYLGALGPALIRWASISGQTKPAARRPSLTIFAATHDGSGGDRRHEADVLAALAAGGMPVNFACGDAGVGLRAFELALDHPTPDPVMAETLSERDCAATIAFGMEALADSPDIVLLSGLPSTGAEWAGFAVYCALNRSDEAHARPDDSRLAAAFERIGDERDALAILRQLGGRDLAAMAGAILAARAQRALVILEGWGAVAAGRVIEALDADAAGHCIVAESANSSPGQGAPVPPALSMENAPIVRCSATNAGYGLAAVSAFVQLKMAALIVAKAPPAKQLGLDA